MILNRVQTKVMTMFDQDMQLSYKLRHLEKSILMIFHLDLNDLF